MSTTLPDPTAVGRLMDEINRLIPAIRDIDPGLVCDLIGDRDRLESLYRALYLAPAPGLPWCPDCRGHQVIATYDRAAEYHTRTTPCICVEPRMVAA